MKGIRYLRGGLPRRTMLFVMAPLLLATHFGMLGVAALLHPESYDWRHNSISRLVYPRNNPLHSLASTSLAASGVLMIPFADYIRRRLRTVAPTTTAVGASAFMTGCILLILAGLITSHPVQGRPVFPKLHDYLASLSVVGMGIGIMVFNGCGTKAYFWPNPGQTRPRRSLVVAWNLLTLPLLFSLGTSLVTHAYLKRAATTQQTIVTSTAWHVGFWEWIGSAVIILFLICGVLFLPEHPSD